MNICKDQNFSFESLEYYFSKSFAPLAILTGTDFVYQTEESFHMPEMEATAIFEADKKPSGEIKLLDTT